MLAADVGLEYNYMENHNYWVMVVDTDIEIGVEVGNAEDIVDVE